MRQKDMTEKTLEAYNDVFADIVNGLLFGGEQIVPEQSLTEAGPVSMYKTDGRVHEMERDVAKYWSSASGETINVRIAMLGIENQTGYDKDMPLRVIGYDGAAYRAELLQERRERYPVITLVLYFGNEHWGKNRTLHHVLHIPDRLKPFVKDYGINLFEVSFLTDEEVSRFHSDFRIVADYFAHKRTNPDYRPTDPIAFRHTDELLKLMAAITGDERFESIGISEGGKPRNMCEVLDRAEARGREQGIQQGRMLTLTELVLKNIITIEQAAALVSMTPEEFRALMNSKGE